MARMPLPGESALPATHIECIECESIDPVVPLVSPMECPRCRGEAEPLHVTDGALGYEDDEHAYHYGRTQYEYPASRAIQW